ncbi:GPI-linked NAD(P)(+)--arginine ADP-ribosyltransferase 1-like isoform 1-T1 [Liasis olivaceus]
MKALPLQMVQVLCLMGMFTGRFQVFCRLDIPLTMFDDSVDDQYTDCGPTTEVKVQEPGNIPLGKKYNETWEKARRHWASLGQVASDLSPIYGTAVVAYTVGDTFYSDFNNAVREAGKSPSSYHDFTFKDVHFLLTKAVQARKPKHGCHQVFRGIRNIHFNVSDKVVRFGQFASSSLEKTVAQKYGEDSFFIIKTCFGAQIDDISFHPEEREVLIPPYETFNVTSHSESKRGVVITLESRGIFSHFNCGVKNAAGLSFLTPVGVPFLLWGLLLTWGILGPLGSF